MVIGLDGRMQTAERAGPARNLPLREGHSSGELHGFRQQGVGSFLKSGQRAVHSFHGGWAQTWSKKGEALA